MIISKEEVSSQEVQLLGKVELLGKIEVSGIEVQIVRKPIKNLHLGVYPPNGRVRVAAPSHVTDDNVRLAIISKLSWIKKQQAHFQAQPRQSQREMVSGESHYVWGIKKMKTKWGSCNIGARRIWLNLELAKKPAECLEYILVHEMVHLLERHHNDQFRAYMDKFMPQWRWRRDVLNERPLAHEDWGY